jgi:hypothetical protein
MTVCPACGADSDRIYRCSECGTDLVDVQGDEDPPSLAVTDGGHPPGVSPSGDHPASESDRVDRAVRDAAQLVAAGDSVRVAVDCVVDELDLQHRAADIYQRVREEVETDE